MKIRKVKEPVKRLLGELKNGDLFERGDVEQPLTTYMVCRHDKSVEVDAPKLKFDCTYVVDLANAVFKALPDNIDTIPLELQDETVIVREL